MFLLCLCVWIGLQAAYNVHVYLQILCPIIPNIHVMQTQPAALARTHERTHMHARTREVMTSSKVTSSLHVMTSS